MNDELAIGVVLTGIQLMSRVSFCEVANVSLFKDVWWSVDWGVDDWGVDDWGVNWVVDGCGVDDWVVDDLGVDGWGVDGWGVDGCGVDICWLLLLCCWKLLSPL